MEYRHNPGGFSGKATGTETLTCDRCGAVMDVLHQPAADPDTAPRQTYTVRCPNYACNALLEIALPAPPIAVIPRPRP
jgi:hypothetical protein